MSYTGTVKNGVVMLPEGVGLPDGLEVEVSVTDKSNGLAAEERAAKRLAALRELAAAGGISRIENPGEWQREIRTDRDLPGRGA